MADEAERRARIHELLSLTGLIQSDHDGGPIAAPPAMFSRIARTLTTAADLTDNASRAHALRRDAMRAIGGHLTPLSRGSLQQIPPRVRPRPDGATLWPRRHPP